MEAAQAHAAPSLMLMCVWSIGHVFFFQTESPLDPALAGSKEDLPWCHTQQGPKMGHQLYPQQLQSAAAVQAPGCDFEAGAWLLRAGLPQGTIAGQGTSGLSASRGTTPAASLAGRKGQKPKEGEQMTRTATVGHKDFIFFLYAISVQRE